MTPKGTRMPTEGTKRQSFRLDQGLWDEFGAATQRAEPPADRTAVLRNFIEWYVGKRGAKRPTRPPAPPRSES